MEGVVEKDGVGLAGADPLGEDQPTEEAGYPGALHLQALHLVKAVGEDEEAVRTADVLEQLRGAGDECRVACGALVEVTVEAHGQAGVTDAHRTEHMQHALLQQGSAVDLLVLIALPEAFVIGKVKGIKSLEGGKMSIELIVDKKLFEAFFIVVDGVPQRVVQVDKQGRVAALGAGHPTSTTRYLLMLQNDLALTISSVRLPSASLTKRYEFSGWLERTVALRA